MEFRSFLTEEVYGVNAVVYHRTPSLDNINNIIAHGFKPGAGMTYGRGLYATFDLESQMTNNMIKYGNWLVKFGIQLRDFIILDYDVAKKVFRPQSPDGTPEYSLYDQLKKVLSVDKNLGLAKSLNNRFRKSLQQDPVTWDVAQKFWNFIILNVSPKYIQPFSDAELYFFSSWDRVPQMASRAKETFARRHGDIIDKVVRGIGEIRNKVQLSRRFRPQDLRWETIKGISRSLETYNKGVSQDGNYTAEVAYHFLIGKLRVEENVNGLIFTGKQDGRVCVIYRPEVATMLGYADHPVGKSGPVQWETKVTGVEYPIYLRKQWDQEIQRDIESGKRISAQAALYLNGKTISKLLDNEQLILSAREIARLPQLKNSEELQQWVIDKVESGVFPVGVLSMDEWKKILGNRFDDWLINRIQRGDVSLQDYDLGLWALYLPASYLEEWLEQEASRGKYPITLDTVYELLHIDDQSIARKIFIKFAPQINDLFSQMSWEIFSRVIGLLQKDLEHFDLNGVSLEFLHKARDFIPQMADLMRSGKIDLTRYSHEEIKDYIPPKLLYNFKKRGPEKYKSLPDVKVEIINGLRHYRYV